MKTESKVGGGEQRSRCRVRGATLGKRKRGREEEGTELAWMRTRYVHVRGIWDTIRKRRTRYGTVGDRCGALQFIAKRASACGR